MPFVHEELDLEKNDGSDEARQAVRHCVLGWRAKIIFATTQGTRLRVSMVEYVLWVDEPKF